jgi:hypothetical protein
MIQLACVLGVDIDSEFIPHHLPYYAKRGVKRFNYILHTEGLCEPSVAIQQLVVLARKHDVNLTVYLWQGEFSSNRKRSILAETVAGTAVKGEPYVVVDADEYIMTRNLKIISARYKRAPAVYGVFHDAFAGPQPCVADVLPDVPITDQFPYLRKGYAVGVGCCGMPTKPVIIHDAKYTGIHSHEGYSVQAFREEHGGLLTIRHVRWTTSRQKKSEERAASFKAHGANHWVSSAQAAAVLKQLPIHERQSDGNARTED